jgi:hypothetical protein
MGDEEITVACELIMCLQGSGEIQGLAKKEDFISC